MKQSIIIFLVGLLFISANSFSQGTDGVLVDPNNATTRDASAVFQAQSTTQGILVPRMTAAQRGAIPVSAARDGLMVYQTDGTPGFYYYNGTVWVLIANTTSNLAGITAGTGLTGGGTSGTITVNAVGDNGLTTNADDIDLGGPLTQAATTITQDGSETFTIANTGSGNTTINLSSTGDFDVQDNGTSALFVRDDAFVGIGTNAPNSPLTVRTTVATANVRTSSLANAIGDVNFQLATLRGATTNATGDITTQIGQVYGAGTLSEGIQFIRGGGSTDGAMTFVTNAATERMRINSNGNVGIGSNNPTERLDLNGSIKIPGASTTDNNSPALTLVSDDDFLYDTEYLNHYALGFHQYNDGAGLGANLYASGYYGIDLFTGGTQRFRINNNGTVKINNLAGTGTRFVVADANGNLSATNSTSSGVVTGSGTLNTIPKWTPNGSTLGNSLITDDATTITAGGQLDVTGGTGTGYTTAPIEIRTSAIAPRLAFHYSGVVASQIAIESSGTIAIRDNPGTGYENFIARDISANRNIYNQGILYHRTSAGQGSGAHGISWYDPSFVTWYDYMAPPGTTNAPSGTAAPTDAPTGVTSWARRFNMENIGTYGWLFESGANTAGVAPTVKFAINASTGTFHATGDGDIDGVVYAGASARMGTNIAAGYYQDATNGAYRAIVGSGTTNGYYFQTNAGGNTTMYVGLGGTYNGNVGIGNTTPGSSLHIGSTSWSANQLHFSSGWGAGGYHATIGSGYTGITSAGIMLGNPHIPWRSGYGAKMRHASDQAATHYWDLGINAEAGGTTDRFDLNRNNSNLLTVTNGGNLGVGTTGPGEKIHTTGNILADGIVYWGNGQSRSETRDNAGLQGNAGAKSGFFETSVPTNYYSGASSWQHMIDVRHSNTGNNYAMQLAGSFFDQRFYARKTNNSATTAWSELLTVPVGSNGSTNQAYTLAMHGQFSNDDIGFGWAGNADDTYYSANMGWSITINGTAYSDLTLNTNGTIVFGSQTTYLGYGGTLPNAGTALPVLAWYWRDMVTNYRWGSVGTAPNRVFIIDFDSNAYNTGDDVDGQIQIHETSGLINVFYRVMDPAVNGQNGVIGFQLQGGSSAKTYPIVGYGKAFDDNRLPQSWSVSPVR